MKKILKMSAAFLLAIALLLSMTGCGEEKEAEAAVVNMFEAFKELDFEEAKKYIDVDKLSLKDVPENDFVDYEMFQEGLFDQLEYKIISSKKSSSKKVQVAVEITAVDMKPVLTAFIGEVFQYTLSTAFSGTEPSDEEMAKKMEEFFEKCVSKEDLETVKNEVTLAVVKGDGGWKVDVDETFTDALFGGLLGAFKSIDKVFGE